MSVEIAGTSPLLRISLDALEAILFYVPTTSILRLLETNEDAFQRIRKAVREINLINKELPESIKTRLCCFAACRKMTISAKLWDEEMWSVGPFHYLKQVCLHYDSKHERDANIPFRINMGNIAPNLETLIFIGDCANPLEIFSGSARLRIRNLTWKSHQRFHIAPVLTYPFFEMALERLEISLKTGNNGFALFQRKLHQFKNLKELNIGLFFSFGDWYREIVPQHRRHLERLTIRINRCTRTFVQVVHVATLFKSIGELTIIPHTNRACSSAYEDVPETQISESGMAWLLGKFAQPSRHYKGFTEMDVVDVGSLIIDPVIETPCTRFFFETVRDETRVQFWKPKPKPKPLEVICSDSEEEEENQDHE